VSQVRGGTFTDHHAFKHNDTTNTTFLESLLAACAFGVPLRFTSLLRDFFVFVVVLFVSG
jgi:hypothetical protein